MATKLGIILSFSSFSFLPRTYKSDGGQITKAEGHSPQIFFAFLALAGGVRALWVSEHPPQRMHITCKNVLSKLLC